jgi:membrane protein implicated in regulation of membrane protease activity
MSFLTFFSMLIIGSAFSYGLLLLFKNKKLPGVLMLVLSVVFYICYYYIASAYFL